MALFQNSVLKKYLASQSSQPIQEALAAYQSYFHNPQIRENIRAAKEEQFQEGFLRELFVKILGYTINPEPEYNLTTELKNIKDSKKTDGAILKEGKAIAVIELKGTDTKDLDKIRDQAFNYKNNQPDCVYVITSNFEKLRFYIDNAVDFVEFNLFGLDAEQFRLLWLLLHKDNLLSGIPKKVKEESLLAEEQITKQLYRDYSTFKQELWQDLVAQNPEEDELVLYKKSQKLLDRFLFIFFAEDKGLLPPNSIMEIVNQWRSLQELDAYVPLHKRFNLYFGYLNTGRIQPGKAEIHAYNGGLFAPDPVLDTLVISDEVLDKHVRKLTEYDFESEVDTNILGHIFEHSLNDIENVRAQIAGETVDKSKTKRKRDGVFYTPKYITKYIVDNTLGRLCTEKKAELGIIDEDFAEGKRGRQKKTIQKLKERLDSYRNWLLQLTICDPACGSGAFLNQVLEFLIAEHRYVDELEAQLFDSPLILPNVENHILENNIFGVDINEESVEIARLSLWLRTAKKGRKLSSLNSNIKVGNSLIDDPEVAGDLAFNWAEQFPQVFAKGGFDVVVGNPPYGAKISSSQVEYLFNKYLDFGYSKKLNDTYIAFYIKGIREFIKNNGVLGYIAPNTWRLIEAGNIFRSFIFSNQYKVYNITQHTEKVFAEATVDVDSVFIQKFSQVFQGASKIEIHIGNVQNSHKIHTVNQSRLKQEEFINLFLDELKYQLRDKIFLNSFFLGDYYDVKNGVKPYEKGKGTPPQDDWVMKNKPFTSESKIDESFSPLIGGSLFQRYLIKWDNNYWIKYGPWLAAPREKGIFEAKEKLIFRQTSDRIIGAKISEGVILRDNTHIVLEKTDSPLGLDLLLAILNSKLIDFIYWTMNPEKGEALAQVKLFHIYKLPFPKLNTVTSDLSKKSELIQEKNKEYFKFLNNLIKLLNSKYNILIPSTKLQNWPSLDFKGFLGELKKAKVRLSLSEEAEWMTYFNEQKAKAHILQADIDRLDREIDALVYELYGLTEEEIRIVEGGEG
ncbi:TaqI-like C-terminal specificity domain-containing protein [uncultured Algoriphagus sp.]|uniref:Eco57I restriction-modification methylase domain-containing protein n=1 Tax=uncultured Algoriphagus sp. TaxID=417365 RepID=UPI00258D081D|nr:TaqI-like C-terminal specificity domain-containing protein [uncultured Algoriphagus sp.]